MNERAKDRLYQKALRFLASRPRSEAELRRKGVANEIINRLKQENLVDDKAFINWWIEARTSANLKGPRAISYELAQKGVSKELISKALGKISQQEWQRLASEMLKRKLRVTSDRKKLLGSLMRAGFDWGLSKNLVDELIKKE